MSLIDVALGPAPRTTERPPDFIDQGSCRAWLESLPLTNPVLSQTQLMRQLSLLNRYPLGVDERLKILALLREPLRFVQEQCLKRFAGRPLPFNAEEQSACDASQALWQELVTAYLHCLPTTAGAETEVTPAPHLVASTAATGALAAMRAIHLDACHANILIAPTFWRQLHSIFHAAEELKVARLPVEAGSRGKRTAASAYVEVLLLAAASPHELRPKQLTLVADWAQRWSGKVAVRLQPPADQRTPSLCIDLRSDRTATYRQPPAQSDALRWLDLAELRKSIKKRLVRMAQGDSPEVLHLGRNCEQPVCEAMLKRAYQCWCKGGMRDQPAGPSAVRRARMDCQLVSGFDAIQYHLAGQIHRDQNGSILPGYHEHEQIATFGRIAAHGGLGDRESPGLMLEAWRIADQNPADLRLERPLSPPGKSLVGDQLVAVRFHDGAGFILGKIFWVAMSASRDAVIARIRLLPGKPVGITIRNAGPGSGYSDSGRGLFLPHADQLGEMASMLVPPGWFAPNRIIGVEIEAGVAQEVRIGRLVERGTDFERVTFERL